MDDFTKELLHRIRQAEALGVKQEKLRRNAEQHGGIGAAKYYIGHARLSDGFEELLRLHRPELSMEAMVTEKAYHGLFTDEEVNACFALLCGANYF